MYGDKVYSNFWNLNVLEDGVKFEYFAIISVGSLLVYKNKYYLQVYLNNCAYEIVNTVMIDHFDDNILKVEKFLEVLVSFINVVLR